MSIMVSTRFTSFMLILILLHSKQVKKSVATATSGSGTAISSMDVEVYDGVAEIDERTMLGPGRKPMTGRFSQEIKSNDHTRGGDSEQGKMPGFVSLNLDYHVPRPHPPKNN